MRRHKISKISLMTIILMAYSLMGSYSFFTGSIGSMTWRLLYYGRYIVILFFGICCYLQLKKGEKKTARWIISLLCMPGLVAFLYSCVLWMIHGTTMPYVTRGISNTLFKCIALAGGAAIAIRLKDDVIRCTIASSFLVYSISLLIGLSTQGFAMFKMLNVIGRGMSAAENYVELHELAYVLGLYIVFFLYIYKNKKIKITRGTTLLMLFFFALAWKRIGILAVVILAFYGFFFYKKKPHKKAFFIMATGIAMVLVCHVYVSFSASNELALILRGYGINMMGRDIIYSYFRRFCTYSIDFPGRGIGFTGRQFDYVTSAELYNMASVKALHNDFLKLFIELGFVGFAIWCAWWTIEIPTKIKNKIDINAAFSCMLLIMYTFILYTTDNTDSYFNYQMQLGILISFICYSKCYTGRKGLFAIDRHFFNSSQQTKTVQRNGKK